MKKTLLTILALMLAGVAVAQLHGNQKRGENVAIGIKVGGNLPSYFYTENSDLNALDYDSLLTRVRPMLGLQVEIPMLGGVVYVAPEVLFTQRGDSRLFFNTPLDTLVRYQAKVNYLEARLPISIAIPVSQTFKPYVFAAPSFGLALPTVGPFASEIRQYSLNQAKTLDDVVAVDSSNMAPYDYGVTLGAGLRFNFDFSSFAMIVKLEGGYHLGLKDTYSEKEHYNQAAAVNVNAYNINGKRLNRGIEATLTIAFPLDFHPKDDCFYWSDMEKRKNKNRGLYGF